MAGSHKLTAHTHDALGIHETSEYWLLDCVNLRCVRRWNEEAIGRLCVHTHMVQSRDEWCMGGAAPVTTMQPHGVLCVCGVV